MTITFQRETLNEIFKRCKAFLYNGAANGTPEICSWILIEKTEYDRCEVTALDGFKLIHFTVGVESQKDLGSILIPLVPAFPRGDFVINVTDGEKEVVFEAPSGKRAITRPPGDYPNWKMMLARLDQVENVLYMDPKLLASALSSFPGAVRVEILGAKRGVMIRDSHGAYAYVLPVSPKKAGF